MQVVPSHQTFRQKQDFVKNIITKKMSNLRMMLDQWGRINLNDVGMVEQLFKEAQNSSDNFVQFEESMRVSLSSHQFANSNTQELPYYPVASTSTTNHPYYDSFMPESSEIYPQKTRFPDEPPKFFVRPPTIWVQPPPALIHPAAYFSNGSPPIWVQAPPCQVQLQTYSVELVVNCDHIAPRVEWNPPEPNYSSRPPPHPSNEARSMYDQSCGPPLPPSHQSLPHPNPNFSNIPPNIMPMQHQNIPNYQPYPVPPIPAGQYAFQSASVGSTSQYSNVPPQEYYQCNPQLQHSKNIVAPQSTTQPHQTQNLNSSINSSSVHPMNQSQSQIPSQNSASVQQSTKPRNIETAKETKKMSTNQNTSSAHVNQVTVNLVSMTTLKPKDEKIDEKPKITEKSEDKTLIDKEKNKKISQKTEKPAASGSSSKSLSQATVSKETKVDTKVENKAKSTEKIPTNLTSIEINNAEKRESSNKNKHKTDSKNVSTPTRIISGKSNERTNCSSEKNEKPIQKTGELVPGSTCNVQNPNNLKSSISTETETFISVKNENLKSTKIDSENKNETKGTVCLNQKSEENSQTEKNFVSLPVEQISYANVASKKLSNNEKIVQNLKVIGQKVCKSPTTDEWFTPRKKIYVESRQIPVKTSFSNISTNLQDKSHKSEIDRDRTNLVIKNEIKKDEEKQNEEIEKEIVEKEEHSEEEVKESDTSEIIDEEDENTENDDENYEKADKINEAKKERKRVAKQNKRKRNAEEQKQIKKEMKQKKKREKEKKEMKKIAENKKKEELLKSEAIKINLKREETIFMKTFLQIQATGKLLDTYEMCHKFFKKYSYQFERTDSLKSSVQQVLRINHILEKVVDLCMYLRYFDSSILYEKIEKEAFEHYFVALVDKKPSSIMKQLTFLVHMDQYITEPKIHVCDKYNIGRSFVRHRMKQLQEASEKDEHLISKFQKLEDCCETIHTFWVTGAALKTIREGNSSEKISIAFESGYLDAIFYRFSNIELFAR